MSASAEKKFYFRVVCNVADAGTGMVALSPDEHVRRAGSAPLDTTFYISAPDSVEVGNATFYLHGIPTKGYGVDHFYNNDVGYTLSRGKNRNYVVFELNSSRQDVNNPAAYHFTVYFKHLPSVVFDGETTDAHNLDSILAHAGYANVTLHRSMPSVDSWYTICLPFNLSNEQLKEAFGDDYNLQEYDSEYDTNSDYDFRFRRTDTLIVGKPYFIKPSKPVTDALFESVLIQTKQTAITRLGSKGFEMRGTRNYNPEDILAGSYGDRARFFHGLNLITPNAGHGIVCATRCYFLYPKANSQIKKVSLIMDNGETTDIRNVDVRSSGQSQERIYNIMGQFVGSNMQSLPHGVYIIEGRKVRK